MYNNITTVVKSTSSNLFEMLNNGTYFTFLDTYDNEYFGVCVRMPTYKFFSLKLADVFECVKYKREVEILNSGTKVNIIIG